MIEKGSLWFIIFALGIGSFMLRFSFLGLVGDRPLPAWALRYLRYTAVAIIPALIAPMVALSNEANTGPEPVRLIAAIVTSALAHGPATSSLQFAQVLSLLGLGCTYSVKQRR